LRTSSGSQGSEFHFNLEAVEIQFFASDHPLTEEEKDHLIEAVRELPRPPGVLIQAFDSNRIYGKRHLRSALYHAIRSRELSLSRSRDLSVDVVRYAAGERQIHVAFEKVGLRKGTRGIAVLVYSPIPGSGKGILKALTGILKKNGFRETEGPVVGRERELEALERTALLDLKL